MTNNPQGHDRPGADDSVDWALMARYAAGECAPEESAHVRRWFEEHPAEARLVAALDGATKSLAMRPAGDIDVEGALQRVRARMDEPVVRHMLPYTRADAFRFPIRPRMALAGLAAAAGIVAIIVVTQRSERTAPQAIAAAPLAPRVYATAVGARDSLLLGDGTRVLLGPGSRLSVPADYGQRRRAVELTGVAYFDVKHNATAPFTVREGQALIEDIGTTFTVQDEADGTVSVDVTAGRVQLSSAAAAAQQVQVPAGGRGTVDATGRARSYQGVKDEDLAWMRGRLEFQEAPMTRVAADLQRWYGIELRPDSAFAHRHVTATFTNERVTDVIRVIGLDLGARAEQRGDTVFLHPLRGRPAPQ